MSYGLFGFGDVAPTARNVRAKESGRVVFNLRLHDVVHLAAADRHRMRSSRIGSVGHGCDIGGFENKESGGGGARTAGAYEDDDRNAGGLNFCDDLAGGIEQTAGGIDFD